MLTNLKRFVVWALWAALLAGCNSTAPTSQSPTPPEAIARPAEPNIIVIDNFTYTPATLTVDRGTTLTWINRDDVPHTVTSSDDPKFLNSKTLDTDGKYTATFTTAGTYPYYCKVHPHMTATIIVK